MKQYVAIARVSSAQQQREGHSLDEQESKLTAYAKREGGQIIKLFKVAETASRSAERKVFREMIDYVDKNAFKVNGVLFVRIDRAARNMRDFVDLEDEIEKRHRIPLIFIDQPFLQTPAGRMSRYMFEAMAGHQTELQSEQIRECQRRRAVEHGLFVGTAPYGYRNVRKNGRGQVEVDPQESPRVIRIFNLYAYEGKTLESLGKALKDEGIVYSDAVPEFHVSQLHRILTNRAYIGELWYSGEWHPGTHDPLVNHATFDRVQGLLGRGIYRAHKMTYASELIKCGHCNHPITGELKTKNTATGRREYTYYRCVKYNAQGHPRVRLTESQLDDQVLGLFDRLQLKDAEIRQWFVDVIRARSAEAQRASRDQLKELERQRSAVKNRMDRLLDMRLAEEIDADEYDNKRSKLVEQASQLRLHIEACERGGEETAAMTVKAFELSQNLREKWVSADYSEKRAILEIVCLNFTLNDITLVPTIRKPFDLLAEGLILTNSGGGGN